MSDFIGRIAVPSEALAAALPSSRCRAAKLALPRCQARAAPLRISRRRAVAGYLVAML